MIRTTTIRRLAGEPSGDPADADLLARFTHGDAGAFELLVWRHAALVLRTCRAVLRDRHAAEDAAQATFLALARQAAAVGRTGTVAGWLFRVARRVAGRSRKRLPVSDADPDLVAAKEYTEPDVEAAAVLHEELARLPDRYRLPVLLCFFEGHSHAEAARLLGWPVGTVAGRVARAKSRLAASLTRRSVAPAIVIPAVAVPPAFARETARFAARAASPTPTVLALARQEVRMTTATKLARAAALVTACVALTFGAMRAAESPPQPPPEAKKVDVSKPPEPPKPVIQKTFAVAPVTTALQRRLLEAHDSKTAAVVIFDGVAPFIGPNVVDAEAFNMKSLREALRAYNPDKSKALSVRVVYALLPNEHRDAGAVVGYTLEGLGRSSGFGNVASSETHLNGKFNLAECVAPLKENKGADLDEPAFGDERATAYAVHTPLSRVLLSHTPGENIAAVLDIKVPLDSDVEAWVPAELEASVKAALTKLALPKGGSVLCWFRVKGKAATDQKTTDRLRAQARLWLDGFGLQLGPITQSYGG
ncbi:MAG TPA: sigma-70 family RNA polymerase sigma factor [Gemmataceae bacterium]|nr:sigma-70 family RNA polymerase sigma factor [Gemmataceae bacterium]